MIGRPPEHTDTEILRLFTDTDEPVLFTVEVAELLSKTQQSAYNRLSQLEDLGYVASKAQSQQSARVWWITIGGREYVKEATNS
jgi:Mn-dependent DtxR family transcriptional regulator